MQAAMGGNIEAQARLLASRGKAAPQDDVPAVTEKPDSAKFRGLTENFSAEEFDRMMQEAAEKEFIS